MVKTCIINSLIYYMTKIKALFTEKPTSKMLKVFLAIVLIAFSFILIKSFKTEAQDVTQTVTTSVTIGNAAPYFSAGPNESAATVSTTTNPTAEGNDVTFEATAIDSNGQNYYLTVCSKAGIAPNKSADGAGTCNGEGAKEYCHSSSTASGTATSCTYTTLTSGQSGYPDPYTNPWYAYVCDANAETAACSSAAQGSGDSGSPFIVNHPPTLDTVNNTASANPGGSITWTTNANTKDVDQHNVTLVVCKSNSLESNGTCTAGDWCTSSPALSNPSCTYNIPSVAADATGIKGYVFLIDIHKTPHSTTPTETTFAINNVAPTVSNVKLNSEGAITLTTKAIKNVPVTLTVEDNNGCATTEVTSVVAYVYRSGVGSTNCNTTTHHDTNYCYTAINCTQDTGSCTGGASATYTCQVPMQYYADPTVANTVFAGQYWIATVTATDDDNATGTASSTSQDAVVNSLLAFDVSDNDNPNTVVAEINYGSLGVGEIADATALPQRLYTIPTGNVGLDQKHHSAYPNMCTDFHTCSGGTPIPIGKQRYALSAIAYNHTDTTALTGTATEVEINVPKINAGTITHKSTWWGIQIPAGTIAGTYTGQNIITAVVDETTGRWGLPAGEAYNKP